MTSDGICNLKSSKLSINVAVVIFQLNEFAVIYPEYSLSNVSATPKIRPTGTFDQCMDL